ncbi:PTS system IIC component, L-Asc family [Pelagirhabdus alkalitolerans]|uniref:Ascorbate-specific PTS system EIIC component n=1 Tax=Pelagirhabdus alkalitolerans TaxID=1612202 RepID=A0A1G6JSX5_9BACI|nr:PTS ascorbate transporter subunit IIC [Pelagirhabdus alkalitolerans]SDC21106.1 PTS system IIC component, L-Asc family [Pelagirhabdus alkalitolerans]
MQTFLDFLTDNILRNPPVLLGLIAAIGLIIQRKNIADIVKGSLTAAFGMFILDVGVNLIIDTISPINDAFQETIAEEAEVTEALSDVTFLADYGGEVGLAMFIGLILHLVIARVTPVKTIFLTGHMLWWFPFIFVAAGVEGGLSGISLIVFGAILSAMYWSFMPWIMRRYIWDVTGDDSFLIGHPTGILSIISGFVAKRVGNKERSTESLNVPKSLSFFREISVTGSIVIFVVFIIMYFVAPEIVAEGDNFIFNAITQGLTFGAGLIVMLQGVRMLINQIIPAFQGISDKVIPGAIPAFDVPILFNYKPNAVIIGFLVAMTTSTIMILIANTTNLFGVLLVPLVVTSFFEMGGAAIVGEGQGGLKGSIIGTIVSAIVMVGLMGISVVVYETTIQNWLLIFGGNDFSIFGPLASWLAQLFSGVLG